MIEESYTADLSALQHLPEHDDSHHDALDPTCATTGVHPDPGDDPHGHHGLVDDGPDHGAADGHDEPGASGGSGGAGTQDDPLPEPEPHGVGH